MRLTAAQVSAQHEDATEATSLQFRNASITQVDDISFCISLRRLDLSGNALRTSKALASLRHLPSLSWLSLARNSLTDMEALCQIKTLTVLDVSHNQLTLLPDNISKLDKLQALIATDNMIKVLPLRFPPQLDSIVLSKNRLEKIDGSFRSLKLLKKLSLSHNNLHILPDLSQADSLKELRLNGNLIMTLSSSSSFLPPSLQLFDLGNNAVNDTKQLVALQKLPRLRSLNLKGNPISDEDKDISMHVAHLLPALKSLNNRPFLRPALPTKGKSS